MNERFQVIEEVNNVNLPVWQIFDFIEPVLRIRMFIADPGSKNFSFQIPGPDPKIVIPDPTYSIKRGMKNKTYKSFFRLLYFQDQSYYR
jgi:hypothetical protein